jgi:RNA polymerase sigma-70 factor (ECF subfamily)
LGRVRETRAATANRRDDDAGDERELLARLRAGDAAAFEHVVYAYSGRMLAVSRRLLSNEEDAHDAVQDAFISAFKSIDRFEGGARLSTWLHRIVVNAALMKRRSRQRKAEQSIEPLLPKFLDDGHQASPAGEWRVPDSPAEREETRLFVRGCIEQLPESYQVVLKLRDFEGLDTQETADVLGIEANAVKVRLHRARQALRTLLDARFRAGTI